MEHIKDLLNFKENKKYKLIIMILVIIIIFMQTGLSMTKKKIRILTENTNTLSEKLKEYETFKNYNEVENIDDIIADNKFEDKEKNVYISLKSELISRFEEIGKLENKFYNSNIKEGKKKLVFETMNLEMTDNQIKSAFKDITDNEFGIEIVKSKLADNQFFEIYLIEKN